MRIQLYLGSEPVLLEIEENDYKPRITLSNATTSVSAEVDCLEVLADHITGGSIQDLNDDIEKLENTIEELEEKNTELTTDVREGIRTIKRLEEQIRELMLSLRWPCSEIVKLSKQIRSTLASPASGNSQQARLWISGLVL